MRCCVVFYELYQKAWGWNAQRCNDFPVVVRHVEIRAHQKLVMIRKHSGSCNEKAAPDHFNEDSSVAAPWLARPSVIKDAVGLGLQAVFIYNQRQGVAHGIQKNRTGRRSIAQLHSPTH